MSINRSQMLIEVATSIFNSNPDRGHPDAVERSVKFAEMLVKRVEEIKPTVQDETDHLRAVIKEYLDANVVYRMARRGWDGANPVNPEAARARVMKAHDALVEAVKS